MTRRDVIRAGCGVFLFNAQQRAATPETAPLAVDVQPFCADVRRVIEAMDYLGVPFASDDSIRLNSAVRGAPDPQIVVDIAGILDRYTLFNVAINPESRVSAVRGAANAVLNEGGWSIFLIKVLNKSGMTGVLGTSSPEALPDSAHAPGSGITATGVVPPGASRPVQTITSADVSDRWLAMEMFNGPPLAPELSGLELEYRILQLYSRDAGKREAEFFFSAGPTTADLGFRDSVPVVFTCLPAVPVTFSIRDANGSPSVASILIADQQGRIYPCPAKRLAPDFPFQKQIYRASGNSVPLFPGAFTITSSRGPEYLPKRQIFRVGRESKAQLDIELERWIDPAKYGWYSGDHHIHAAGCSHYNTPREGVLASDLVQQVRGEGLHVGEILTWGPDWYFQKQFFSGHIDNLSNDDVLIRYDVEVSGFPSSYWGHLVLLRLQSQDYPGANRIEDWPTWNLPILKWAKSQGAVTGYAHTGHGLLTEASELPNYSIPSFDDNGANEFLVDVTFGLVDFLSAVDTPAVAELNIWYHALNCGFRIPIAGETDFPCLFETVGAGRSYVHLNSRPTGDAGYQAWIEGMRHGSSYVSDGYSHILEFSVEEGKLSELPKEIQLAEPGRVSVRASIAAYLPEKISGKAAAIRQSKSDMAPYWHIERARIGNSRKVAVELIVNGEARASKLMEADGLPHELSFEAMIDRSSWLALRILSSCHSNPIYVQVSRKPVRASARSVTWCRDCIAAAWKRLGGRIAAVDQGNARAAFRHADEYFARLLSHRETGSVPLSSG